MAFTFIQTKLGAITGTTLTISPTLPYIAGNLVTVFLRGVTGTGDVVSVTDNAGNTYTKANGPLTNTSGDVRDWLYYSIQATGGATAITVTMDTSINIGGYASEFNGGGPLDKVSTGQAASGTAGSVTSFSPTGTGELIFAGLDGRNIIASVVAGASYILAASTTTIGVEYELSSGATETAPISWTTSVVWNEIAAAFFSTSTSTSSTSSSTSTSVSTSTSTSTSSTSYSTSSTSTSTSTFTTSTSSTSSSTSTVIDHQFVPHVRIGLRL